MERSDNREPFEERHFTVLELATMWRLSGEFVRQLVEKEPGVTEWVRQSPGARRYRVLRVSESVARRLYARALAQAARHPPVTRRALRRAHSPDSSLAKGVKCCRPAARNRQCGRGHYPPRATSLVPMRARHRPDTQPRRNSGVPELW